MLTSQHHSRADIGLKNAKPMVYAGLCPTSSLCIGQEQFWVWKGGFRKEWKDILIRRDIYYSGESS